MILKECNNSVEYETALNGPIALRQWNSNSDHFVTPNAWVRLFTNVRIRRFLRHERPVGLPVDGVSQVSAESHQAARRRDEALNQPFEPIAPGASADLAADPDDGQRKFVERVGAGAGIGAKLEPFPEPRKGLISALHPDAFVARQDGCGGGSNRAVQASKCRAQTKSLRLQTCPCRPLRRCRS